MKRPREAIRRTVIAAFRSIAARFDLAVFDLRSCRRWQGGEGQVISIGGAGYPGTPSSFGNPIDLKPGGAGGINSSVSSQVRPATPSSSPRSISASFLYPGETAANHNPDVET